MVQCFAITAPQAQCRTSLAQDVCCKNSKAERVLLLHAAAPADAALLLLLLLGALQVQQFYMGMGKLMGSRLEKMGSSATAVA